MILPPYPAYVKADTAFSQQIPRHWQALPLKRTVQLVTERALERRNPVALEHIESWTGRTIPTESTFEGDGTAFLPGDVLFGKLRPYLAKVYRAEAPGEAIGDFHVLRPLSVWHGPFLQYALLNRPFIDMVNGSTFGSKMPRVSWEFMGGLKLPVPPPDDQLAIAGFLCQETARVDALVAEQRRLIDLLNEKRQALISHAVTKGLDPDAPMEPSGVEWIGDVPVHWRVGFLRFYARFRTGGTPSREVERFWSGNLPWVKTGEIDYTTITETEETISEEGLNSCSATLLPPGTLLMALYGQGATRGRVALLGLTATCNQACAAIELDSRVDARYALWFFRFAYPFFRDAGNETTQMNLSIEYVRRIKMSAPPLDEQRAIATALDRDVAALDRLMNDATLAIGLLNERRAALISAAVTGQIDVRDHAAVEVA